MTPRASTSARLRRAAPVALSAALVAGLFTLAAPSTPAAESAPVLEAPAVGETTPSDVPGDTMDDPTIWVDPDDPANSVVIGADHDDNSLTVYDLDGERIQKLPLSHGNNVDLRPGFSLGGKTVPIVGLAGSGDVSFYALDPATRTLSNVTKGGDKLERDDLQKPGEGPFYAHGMCLYDSPVSGNFYAFVVDRFGHVKQFRLTDDGNGKVAVDEVRQIDVEPRPPEGNADETEACVVDDATRSFFLAEQDWYIWRYGAEPTDPTGVGDRHKVDSVVDLGEGGHFRREAEGLAVVGSGSTSYLVASSQNGGGPTNDNTFTVYRGTAPYDFVQEVKVVGSPTADGCENTDGIDAVFADLGPKFPQGLFVCQDNDNDDPQPAGNMNFKYVRLENVVPLGDAVPPPTTERQPPVPQPQTPDPQPQTPDRQPQTPDPQPQTPDPQPQAPAPPVVKPSGYWMLGAKGKVFAFGDARTHGEPVIGSRSRAVDLEPTPSGKGYWVVDDRGAVSAHGDAKPHGSPPATQLAGDEVTSLSATPTGAGYWIFTGRGRVFAFGDAVHLGDLAAVPLNAPVLDSIVIPSGRGYYMVAADGGIFTFGDAQYHGSTGGVRLNAPVQSLVPDPDGTGYWLVASDGGVFAFAADFRGSLGGVRLNRPVTGMVPFGNGYLMVGEDGGIFTFSDKPFSGSLGAAPPADPITSVAAIG